MSKPESYCMDPYALIGDFKRRERYHVPIPISEHPEPRLREDEQMRDLHTILYIFDGAWEYFPSRGGIAMKVSDIMSKNVICVSPEESVAVAARTLTQYNIGVLPVCTGSGKVCGMLTDRDLVTRCMASDLSAAKTTVGQIMTNQVLTVSPEMDASVAAHLMGRKQVRRLPVVENGRLCGMLSLGDLASREEAVMDAADALTDITANLRRDL